VRLAGDRPAARARRRLRADYAIGTSKGYSRGDFMPDAPLEAQFDEGDFIGRLRTLFGPGTNDEYVLRSKRTGYVITAYSGKSGPSYGVGPHYVGALPPADPRALMARAVPAADDPAVAARIAADPVLANYDADRPDMHALQIHERHLSDAKYGPELAVTVARLDALVSAVPPADWEKVEYYDEAPSVYRVGAAHGKAFNVELPPATALEFLFKQTTEDAIDPFAIASPIEYYLQHQDELADQRPHIVAAYRRFVVMAKSSRELSGSLLEYARDLGARLKVPLSPPP
jgi:hypothetical protein